MCCGCRPNDNQGITGRLPVGPDANTWRVCQDTDQTRVPREVQRFARSSVSRGEHSLQGPPPRGGGGYHLKNTPRRGQPREASLARHIRAKPFPRLTQLREASLAGGQRAATLVTLCQSTRDSVPAAE